MAILATQRVLTLDYWKLANDITEGDILFDRLGQPTKVTLVQKYHTENCYRVRFNDGLTIAGDEHLKLPLETLKYRKRVDEYKGVQKFRRPLKLTPTGQLKDMPLLDKRNRKTLSVPTTKPLQLPHQTLPVEPFIFGFSFFNLRANNVYAPPIGTSELVQGKFKDAGYKILQSKSKTPWGEHFFAVKPTVKSHLLPDVPTSIPNNYLLGSVEQRQELFDGIMSSRNKRFRPQINSFVFTSKVKLYASQVQYLAESLGYKTIVEHDIFYTVKIKNKKPKVRRDWRFISEVYAIQPQGCVHIETDGEGFLVGEGFIPCQ